MREVDFDVLVRRHGRAVHTYARSLTRDRWQAEEAVQETFLRAWKYQDSYSSRGSFEGWLIRICRNCIIDLAQRESRHDGRVDLIEPTVDADCVGELHELLARMPLAHREVIVLCRVLGYDYESAAAILDIPVGTVRSRLNRAREHLDLALRGIEQEARPA